MGRVPAAFALVAVGACAAVLVSGGSSADPRTPPALAGYPAPFLGTAVVGAGGLAAAIDSYGAVVDLRPSGPAGESRILNPSARQAAGTVSSETGIVPRIAVGDGGAVPLWRLRQVRQEYVPGSNVLRTTAAVDGARVRIVDAAAPGEAALVRSFAVTAAPRVAVALRLSIDLQAPAGRCRPSPASRLIESNESPELLVWHGIGRLNARLTCSFGAPQPTKSAADGGGAMPIAAAIAADRRWLSRALPLGAAAPVWAQRLYDRSLLILRALTDARTGAAAAGARDGWAYVWPRDAAAVAIALARAGYRTEARRVVGFLRRLDQERAARFRGDGSAVSDGRPLQGDADGWIEAAARAAGVSLPDDRDVDKWRRRGDYQERSDDRGDYLANAIAAGEPAARLRSLFAPEGFLYRRAGDPGSGLDSAAAWAVRPFPRPALRPLVRRSLLRLLAAGGRFGIQPAQDWPGDEPWSAPTAWVAWSFAALGERAPSLRLLEALRRAATPAGALPERVDAAAGIPRSTTPLAWSHAFAILALRELWPAADRRDTV